MKGQLSIVVNICKVDEGCVGLQVLLDYQFQADGTCIVKRQLTTVVNICKHKVTDGFGGV